MFKDIYNSLYRMERQREIIEELTIDEFKSMRANLNNEVIIIKFGAEWCKPCNKIKPRVTELFGTMPSNVIIVDIDIDDTMDLYMAFRNKKMLTGVPTLLAFHGDVKHEPGHWYISDRNVSGSDMNSVEEFFKHCSAKATSLA